MPHHLISHLDDESRRKVDNVRAAAAVIWKTPLDPSGVDHGSGHSERVMALLGGLTEGLMERQAQRLATEEICILLSAACLHAIGLQDEKGESDPDVRWAQ